MIGTRHFLTKDEAVSDLNKEWQGNMVILGSRHKRLAADSHSDGHHLTTQAEGGEGEIWSSAET
jgi:hypothetical protein